MLLPFRVRSSSERVRRGVANFGIGALAEPKAHGRKNMLTPSKRHRLFATCACCPQPFAATGVSAPDIAAPRVSRRAFMAGGAALGLTAASGLAPTAFAQAKPHRIDVHHHVVPPRWLDAMNVIG